MNLDPALFFNAVRSTLFGGKLTQPQVSGMTAILDAWDAGYADQDERWLAYALATAFHETARTMQPIREWGLGRGRAYGVPDPVTHQVYYGRGLVQLTWKSNYAKMSSVLGLDLVNNPDLALVPINAAAIMFRGMTDGMFTGVKFSTYFNDQENDAVNARRIINGTDCAEEIAGYYDATLAALDVGS